MSLSFVDLECGTSCGEGTRWVMGEGELPPTPFLSPFPHPPQRPLEGLGNWLLAGTLLPIN